MTEQRIAIGLIRTSFGFKGELKVLSFSGESGHFLGLSEILLKDKGGRFLPYQVESSRMQKQTILLKLAGINTPEQVKLLQGFEIWVERKHAAPKAEDEYYHADLCLCSAYLGDQVFGRIRSLVEGYKCELLEIITADEKTILVPFADRYVGDVDIQNRKVFLKETVKEL